MRTQALAVALLAATDYAAAVTSDARLHKVRCCRGTDSPPVCCLRGPHQCHSEVSPFLDIRDIVIPFCPVYRANASNGLFCHPNINPACFVTHTLLSLVDRSANTVLSHPVMRFFEVTASAVGLLQTSRRSEDLSCSQRDLAYSPPVYPSPWMDPSADGWAEAYIKAKDFVSQLTLLEKVNLTTGVG